MGTGLVRRRRWSMGRSGLVGLVLGSGVAAAMGGGSADNVMLIVDPTDAESMYVANYYRAARGVPDENILYIKPHTNGYATFAASNSIGFQGELLNRDVRDHVDYILLMPNPRYRLGAAGLVSDACSPVSLFAVASCFTIAPFADEILGGRIPVTKPNWFFSSGSDPIAFDSSTKYFMGAPSQHPAAQRYFIGAQLGYTGQRGNTLDDILTMVDRSVAVDGTRPGGTFYFMETTDAARSEPRDPLYPATVQNIIDLGGSAELLMAVLPLGRHDAQGIMTGWATPNILGGDFTIQPGAFCDHLTSFAGTFDTASQTKMSEWIAKGASLTVGAVQEPCNYPGKFPRATIHTLIFQGMSLGEAYFRSAQFVPFQMLLYGDPVTRPFAYIPQVSVPDAPPGTVAGTITLSPLATTDNPAAGIAGLDLHVDGVLDSSILPGESFTLDTTLLADGWHEIRVIAFEDSPVKTQGRWIGSINVDNAGLSSAVSATPTAGDLDTAFRLDVSSSGGAVDRIDLLHNGRIVASVPGASGSVDLFGQNLGAGTVDVRARAHFADGSIAESAPVRLDVGFTSAGSPGPTPVAFSYERTVFDNQPFVVGFPASFVDDPSGATFTIVSGPSQATVAPGGGGLPYRILTPAQGAAGSDAITFHVQTPSGLSNDATVLITYVEGPLDGCIADIDGGGTVDVNDFFFFVVAFGLGDPAADLNQDGSIDVLDFFLFVQAFQAGCDA